MSVDYFTDTSIFFPVLIIPKLATIDPAEGLAMDLIVEGPTLHHLQGSACNRSLDRFELDLSPDLTHTELRESISEQYQPQHAEEQNPKLLDVSRWRHTIISHQQTYTRGHFPVSQPGSLRRAEIFSSVRARNLLTGFMLISTFEVIGVRVIYQMDKQYDSAFSERRAVRPLSVIVVGAGIGGLALGYLMRKTGHDVGDKPADPSAEVILERRMEIAEVGAGLQLAPNCLRILRRFGLLDETMKHATVLERNSLRRWMDDEELGSIPLVPDVEDHFGAPLAVIHRADLQRILYDAAIRSGCKILKDHEVIDVDQQFLPRLAAAGGYIDQLVPIQESAYRFVLPKELVKHDEKIMSLLNKNQGMRYLGPGGHIMAYPLRNNTLYNVVLVRAADGEISNKTSWTTYGKKEKILECYREWCPLVRALISHVPSSGLLETPMSNMLPLPTWYKGKIALAGDACRESLLLFFNCLCSLAPVTIACTQATPNFYHAEEALTPGLDYMLPYVAQGAANAIEDAGTLAMAFTCTDQIELALELYQLVRKDRSERIQASAGNNGLTLHLPDGEGQRRRDESIRAASRGMSTANPDQWSDRENREFMWNVDVMAETIEKFESLAQETVISHDS
ncbi:hypothetical protein FHL15_010396 [Xylaria flabelliformis]|uniref:FAD-binding domain-containing protein n=1 Tax=Xylaria flabelliformis TaxID=2512241 RepID=A0A553HL94_9PEZI|nr:hypothetical protein FHL15_010396 [Xylaria flabelliformis]